jgi:hypothetical protein
MSPWVIGLAYAAGGAFWWWAADRLDDWLKARRERRMTGLRNVTPSATDADASKSVGDALRLTDDQIEGLDGSQSLAQLAYAKPSRGFWQVVCRSCAAVHSHVPWNAV